jgi:MerR family transcriptional regulator, light-induced transcriptional regulator
MTDMTTWEDPQVPRPERKPVNGTSRKQRKSSASAMARLLQTIEGEIIPRLLLAHQGAAGARATEGRADAVAETEDVAEFARLVVQHDIAVATQYVQALLARGLSLERVYLDLLAPTARLLGEWWKEDLRDFTEVTSGLCRMHQLLHEFSSAFLSESQPMARGHRVLLTPMPGEQHTFGLIMVGEFFRRSGWDVWDMYPTSDADLLALVKSQSFAVIGISLSCGTRMSSLPQLIRAVRSASRNPAIGVMVGGTPFVGHPELVLSVGADCTATDGRQAPLEASKLIGLLENRV